MKDRFSVDLDERLYDEVKDILRNKEPYVTLACSSTGLGDKDMPIRLCMNEYGYNRETRQYEVTKSFDELVDCGEEALQNALAHKDSYDVFKEGHIDFDEYQKNKLSQGEFREKANYFLDSVPKGTMILTTGKDFCEKMLHKAGCRVQSFADCPSLIRGTVKDFNKDKVEKIQEYHEYQNARVSINDTKITGKLEQISTLKSILPSLETTDIEGADTKCTIMNNLVVGIGEKEKLIEKREKWDKQASERHQDAVERGKKDYREKPLAEKVEFLKGEKHLDEDLKEYKAFNEVLKGKGFNFIACSTTGIKEDDEVIAIGLYHFKIEDGVVYCESSAECVVEADKDKVMKAVNNQDFNPFEYAKIDFDKYIKGEGVVSIAIAYEKVKAFVQTFSDSPIVAMGQSEHGEYSFAQEKIAQMFKKANEKIKDPSAKYSSFKMLSEKAIDLSEVIKESAYIQVTKGTKSNLFEKDATVDKLNLAETEIFKETEAEGEKFDYDNSRPFNNFLQAYSLLKVTEVIRKQNYEMEHPLEQSVDTKNTIDRGKRGFDNIPFIHVDNQTEKKVNIGVENGVTVNGQTVYRPESRGLRRDEGRDRMGYMMIARAIQEQTEAIRELTQAIREEQVKKIDEPNRGK